MTRILRTVCLVTLAAVAGLAPTASADELTKDLTARRAKLIAKATPESILVFFSAPERTYSNDVDYEYRQDSDLYYLTGITQPDTILVLMPGNRTTKEFPFVRPADPLRDHREGHTLTAEEAAGVSGVAHVLQTPAFEGFLTAALSGRPPELRRKAGFEEFGTFLAAVEAGRARLGLMLSPAPALS